MGEIKELLIGWRKGRTRRGDDAYYNDEREMLILSSTNHTTLARENEVFIEFSGPDHFVNALRRSDEILAEYYANKH